MSSEAITRNDLTAILNEVLPPTPSEYRKLLWTNPSPTADFAAQTISLDLSDYDEIEIEARHTPSLNAYCKVKVGDDGYMYAPELSGTGTGYVQNVARKFTVSSSGIVFGGGYYTYGSNSSATASNSKLVPIRIYGIKYERVAPPQEEIADVVVEQGTSGIWTYRKWNSGLYEVYGRPSDSFAMTGSLNGTYYGNKAYTISGLSIVSFINVQITGEASGAYFGSKVEGLSTSTLTISARASSSTTATVIHNVYMLGTWK